MIFKIISTIAFVVGTACVGYLFKLRLITNRTDGGKARIFLYITIYLTLIGVLFGIVSFLEDSGVYILEGLFVVASIWLFIAMFKNKKVTKSNKIQRQRCKIVIQQKENESKKEHVATHVVQKQPEEQLKTLYQLWNEKDVTAKSIAVTNTINPDLK